MRVVSTFLILAASTSYAVALSAGCTTQLGVLALGGLGSCLQLTSLLPVLTSSGSVVDPLNSYLKSLCSSSTPTCSNDTLTSASSSLNSSCSSDLNDGGTNGAEVKALLILLRDYNQVHAAACSTNSSTGDYCVTDTLNTIQNASGSNVTLSSVASIISGTSSDTSNITSVFSSGQLCTQCVSGMYYEALQANSSVGDTEIGKALTSKCGSDFGKTSPNTTATSTSGGSSSPATSSASSSSGFVSAQYAGLAASVGIAGSVLGAVIIGSTMML
ncbi:hypothetical protein I305_01046 [Cryptococcus gattii E566]|uniref:DUF7729 domain-containing protein n=2 Tax=Cryptococcus gattii TaxID=37769 RepID=E6R0H6_CRYGW|nr:Hypothetical protein CGB_B3340W [Cryptococcus gattii WM276]ADV20314.1 Hypothetical protein CGB_B3340W [Cryptococcus gattii WM276]KIR77189.1 hypothetical protein I306_05845 [Cryptococcus gattii EJB2]KIY36190.1 hypothetical protein I305_01046 [Cryptococcus gattii E566]KJE06160.1 hypothetical protein I311_00301 [Cryptococcus gattii NT-10]